MVSHRFIAFSVNIKMSCILAILLFIKHSGNVGMSGYHDKNGFTSHVSCGSTGPLLHRLNYHYQALYTSPQPLSPSKHVTVPRPLQILRPENVLKICSNNIQFSIKIIKLTKSDHSMMRCKTNARKMLFAQGRMIRVAGRIFRTVF